MKELFDRIAMTNAVRLGWLHPRSALAELICPDLARQARSEGWEHARFIAAAMPTIPNWIGTTLGVRDSVREATTQNFMLRMMSRRPDLFLDPSKGSGRLYITGLLRKILYETLRQEKCGCHIELADSHEDRGQSPLTSAATLEELHIVRGIISKLPVSQQRAVCEKYFSASASFEGTVPQALSRVRRCRGLRAIRDEMARLAGSSADPMAVRRRLRRSKRKVRNRSRRPRWVGSANQLRKSGDHVTLGDAAGENREMSSKQKDVELANSRALRALMASLPESLRDRVDVLSAVRTVFEQEFARHISRGGPTIQNDAPSS
jgi:hypothetical protein